MKLISVSPLRVNRRPRVLRSGIHLAVLFSLLCLLPGPSWAGDAVVTASQAGAGVPGPTGADLQDWLQRISRAAKERSYSGTFVVQSGGRIVTSTIDHYVEPGSMLERVETLDGERRIMVCHNDQTRTILPDARLIVVEDLHADFSFPRMLKAPHADVSAFYTMKREGHERCAGYVCDITRIKPNDDLRYGYRLWTERGSGLLVKAQTLDAQGKVLDQVAFTQLNLNPKPRPNLVTQALQGTEGYQVEHMRASPTSARAQGWTLAKPVPGFESVGTYQRRLVLRGKPVEVTQWLFSDGLASVSLFAGPTTDSQRQGASLHMGDTNALLDRKGSWSVIVVGAVPDKTLHLFADSLTRLH
ncbi:MAG: MucB/RseB C-terminal domain-containing protein [Betaproteobacteria bacterium]|jgi:sigma-E factor negative regulatory protein RseB|nr:MucB/RseB C-terminal domain-containing protein [Betaproteobacteria bacterium]OZB45211.1 MAG: hypothetical protein B7X46_05205 [Thiomonas sp. 15-66-11]OZB52263.1 MAG: hypothetical protein B7X42_03235 [Thiomonas sp. 14-66-4]OZB65887.1 MAG: hypothetical protein B7X31_01130 [Thiomonas sp. 13-66-29]